MTEKVKVSQKVANILNQLKREGKSNEDILFQHKIIQGIGGWRSSEFKPMNDLDMNTLKKALEHGYESEGMILEASEPLDLVEPIHSERPQPKTPHQMGGIQIVRMVKMTTENPDDNGLELELDYELASLHDAMERQDEREIDRCKKRLAEIHKEMDLETV